MWSNGRLNFSWSCQRGIWITSNYLSELKISFGCIRILHCIECGRILQRASLVRWPKFPSLTTFFLRWPRFQSNHKIKFDIDKVLKSHQFRGIFQCQDDLLKWPIRPECWYSLHSLTHILSRSSNVDQLFYKYQLHNI